MPGKRAQVEKGLGKRLQGMLRPIAVIQKKDRFGLGYKPDKKKRQGFIEEKRQNRISIFLEKEMKKKYLEVWALTWSSLKTKKQGARDYLHFHKDKS